MGFTSLSTKDREIVLRCMKAALAYIDDWEKHARLGLDANDLHREIAQWPNIDDRAETGNGFLAINNCMNEVCHGFRIPPEEWSRWFDTSISEIEATYQRWLTLKGTLRRNTLKSTKILQLPSGRLSGKKRGNG